MIIYTCICRSKDAVVLVESNNPQLGGNASQVTLALMEALRDNPELVPEGERRTYSQHNEGSNDFFSDLINSCTGGLYVAMDGTTSSHFFHVVHKDGVFFSCLSDDEFPREQQVNFDFLERLRLELNKEFRANRIANAKSMGLSKKFLPSVRSAMHYYNINHSRLARERKVQKMLDRVENMKAVLGRNIQLVLRNQQQELDHLVEQSEAMEEGTKVFKRRADMVKSTMHQNKFRWSAGLVILIIALTYLLLAAICGFNFYHCRIRDR